MNRKLGVCTWTFGPRPIAEIARRVQALGYDGAELHGDLQAFRPRAIASLFDDHGLEVFSLTPDNVDPATPVAVTRAAALDYYRRLVDFAAEAGGAIVSFHGLVGRIAPLASMAGANPFTPVKPGDYLGVLEAYLEVSRDWLRAA